MDAIWSSTTVLAFFSAASIGCVLTALARIVAPRLGWVDQPDKGRKLHRQPTPLMGGLAMFGGLAVTLVLFHLAFPNWLLGDLESWVLCKRLLASGALFCGLGLWDDRWPMRPREKLLGQVLASLPFVLQSPLPEAVRIAGYAVPLGPLAGVFAIFWLVACTNVINLLDGMDGLAGSVGALVMLTFSVLCLMDGRDGVAVINLVIAGAISGFLLHNLPPAKIFMGDAGSLLIGFLAGALSLESSYKTAAGFALVMPIVVMSIPIFDTVMAIARRKLKGKKIGEGDRGHIHHRLQDRGLSRQQALLAITGLSGMMALVAITSAYFQSDLVAAGLCLGVLVLLMSARVFGDHEAWLFFRHLRAIGSLFAESAAVLQTRLYLARINDMTIEEAGEFWDRLCRQVAAMGGRSLEFRCDPVSMSEPSSQLHWRQESADEVNFLPMAGLKPNAIPEAAWEFRITQQRSDGWQARIVARGVAMGTDGQQRLDDLFHTFRTFCQQYPVETTRPTEAATPATAGVRDEVPVGLRAA